MSLALGAFAVALIAWWFATGAVIVAARPTVGHPLYLLVPAAALAVAGLVLALATAGSSSVVAVYGAFFAALAIWAFHEITFLTGHVAGPRRSALPAGVTGAARFRLAYAAVRDHEFVLFATGVVLIALLAGAANPFAWAIYALMWVMRLLTKFNVFLGAPNAVSEILPERMAYLTSYFRTDRVHPFFIVSVTAITCLFTICVYMAATADAPGMVTGWSLMATFAFLGLIEHLFLVLPVRDAALWGWATGRSGGGFVKRQAQVAPEPETASSKDVRADKRAAPVMS